MRRALPPRLRAPILLVVLAAVPLALDGAAYGWTGVFFVAPVVLVIAVGLYALGGRDSDAGALIRRRADERLASQRLRVQALVGRVMALAVAVAYLAAVAAKATLWPFAALLVVLVASFAAGWWIYGEHGHRGPTTHPHGDAE